MDLQFRDACPQDARLLAMTVMEAIGASWDDLSWAEKMCAAEDTLYSWKRARIAVVDGVDAGCLIAYPGEEYETLRDKTWNVYWNVSDYTEGSFELETFPGEFYLDSLAVLPEFRGRGIGRALLRDGMRKGRDLGFGKVTLITEASATSLVEYYRSVGFEPGGIMRFFGYDYLRMSYQMA